MLRWPDYLRTVRMDTTARLLQENDLPVAEIAPCRLRVAAAFSALPSAAIPALASLKLLRHLPFGNKIQIARFLLFFTYHSDGQAL